MSQISLRTLHPQFVQLARPLGLQRRPGVQGLLEAALAVVHQGLLMTRHLIAQRGIGLAQAAQRLRVVMQREGDRGDWVLAIMGTNRLREVEFHGPFDADGSPLNEVVRTGLDRPWVSRPLQSEHFAFRVRLNAPGQYTAYLRVVSNWQPLTFTAFDLPDHMAARQDKRLFDGVTYGMLPAASPGTRGSLAPSNGSPGR